MHDTTEDATSGITSLGPRPPEQELREHLASALTSAGFKALCREEDRPDRAAISPAWAGISFTVAFTLAVVLSSRALFGLGAVAEVLVGIGALVVLLRTAGKTPRRAGVIFLAWVGLGIWVWSERGFGELLSSYGLAIAAGVAIYLLRRMSGGGFGADLRAFLRSIPLLFPLVLLLLFAPLVSADFWAVVGETAAWRVLALSAIILIPLTFSVMVRLISSVPGVISEIGHELAADPNSADRVHLLVDQLSEDNYAGSWVLNNGREPLKLGFLEEMVVDFSPFLARSVRGPLSWALLKRTALMLIGLGACVFGYLYLLSAVLVPSGVAETWSGTTVTHTQVAALGVELSICLAPYLATSAVLSVIALGAFLALLTVEEGYSTAMAGALLHEPVREFLTLALPYTRLRERAILGEADETQVGPFAGLGPSADDAEPGAEEGAPEPE